MALAACTAPTRQRRAESHRSLVYPTAFPETPVDYQAENDNLLVRCVCTGRGTCGGCSEGPCASVWCERANATGIAL